MELRHLRHALEIANSSSLTEAANTLGIAQPALSQSIARLEKSVGARLFTRSRRGSSLTPAGAAFLEGIQDAISTIDASATKAERIGAGLAGKLTVAFVTAACFDLLEHAIPMFRSAYPNVDLELREQVDTNVADALRQHAIDVAIVHSAADSKRGLRAIPLSLDETVAVVPSSFPLEEDGRVKVKQLKGMSLIVFPEQSVPGVRARMAEILAEQDVEIGPFFQVSKAITALCCVAGGIGIGFAPRSMQTMSFRGVAFAPFERSDMLPPVGLSAFIRANSQERLAGEFVSKLQAAVLQRG